MEKPTVLCNGRNSSAANSPEFEFWMTRNPSSHQTTLPSADQLFSGGILLPLHLLNHPPDITTTNPRSVSVTSNPDNILGSGSGSDIKPAPSKRWKDIFKKTPEVKEKEKKKKERSNVSGSGTGSGAGTTAELNINLWPFSRSRSAGNSGSKPRTVVGNRKVSSAPCSRSNSTGDNKYRKWPSSPGRVGVHLGRSSPVWQAKRFGQSRSLHDSLVKNTAQKSSRPVKTSTAGVNGKVLNINVPTCIGYRKGLSCRSDVNSTGRVAEDEMSVTAGSDGVAGGLFNLRSLFSKKVF